MGKVNIVKKKFFLTLLFVLGMVHFFFHRAKKKGPNLELFYPTFFLLKKISPPNAPPIPPKIPKQK